MAQNQQTLEHRMRKLTRLIEMKRLQPERREDFDGVQIGVFVKEGVTVWGHLPANEDEDDAFVEDLAQQARFEAGRP